MKDEGWKDVDQESKKQTPARPAVAAAANKSAAPVVEADTNVVQPMPRGRGALYLPRRCQGKCHKGRKLEHRFTKDDRQTIPSQGQSDQSSK